MMEYKQLREIDVSKYTEKKNNLTYLSWAWAVDQLLLADQKAHWFYSPHQQWGETVMVFCTVVANDIARTAQLPVMDYKNKAILNPDAFAVNTAMQRCLAKAIALHGIGLYIYAGEDVPKSDDDSKDVPKPTIKTVNGTPVDERLQPIKPTRPIVGEKGEFQIVAPAKPESELDVPQWLANIKEACKVLLMVSENQEDVMHIFKKNKTLFDIVKATDAVFFKELMALFTEAKTQLTKE
jgi:hypothetical protein